MVTVVLMVDDNPLNLAELYELLTEAGYQVSIAESGASALWQADHSPPDLILLDVLMPGMNGFAVCAKLKESAKTAAIPVLFMTALDDTADKLQGLRLGAVDYITKPFQHEEVLARIQTHLTLARLRSELQTSERRLANIVAYAMDAIITVDTQRRILLLNEAAERIFRTSMREAQGNTLDRWLTPPFQEYLVELAARNGALEATWIPEGLHAVRSDGDVFPVEGSVSPVDTGDEVLFTVTLRDAQERQQRLKAEAECRKLAGINTYLEEELRAAHNIDALVGSSPALNRAIDLIRQVAGTDSTVLVTGETGTGKELIARAVHKLREVASENRTAA